MKTIITLPIDFAGVPHSEFIDLYAASRLIPGRQPGSFVNLDVLRRYADPKEGCPAGPQHARVYVVLPSRWYGSKRFTTRAAVDAWLAKRDELDNPGRPSPAAGH